MKSKLLATCLLLAVCLQPAFAQETAPPPPTPAATPALTTPPEATAT